MLDSTSLDVFPPNSGEEFELLIADLLEAEYDSKTSRHGRSGQSDDGVDIYFTSLEDEMVGVQCKRTDDLSIQTVQSEVNKATAFSPPLDTYIIATSALQDKHLQEEVRHLNDGRAEDKFDIELLMWDDVTRLLSKHRSIFQNYYAQYLTLPDVTLAEAGVYEISDGYLEQKPPRSAKTAWQLEFTISEIRAGYAFDRLNEDSSSVVTQLTSAARSGRQIALCGEAGSGKSTAMKQVCCQLHNEGVPTLFCPDTSSPESAKDAIKEWAADQQDGVIVVEDAHRAGLGNVFNLVELCERYDHIGLVTAARELSSGSQAQDLQIESNRPLPSTLETVSLPPISIAEAEAAVEKYENVTNTSLQVSPKVIFQQIHQEPHSSSVLSLIYLLSILDKEASDPAVKTDVDSILGCDVRQVRAEHESECERTIAMQTALLKTSRLPLNDEFFHTLNTQGYSHAEIDAALETLEGTILFHEDGDEYQTKHEMWCVEYLKQALNEKENAAIDRFERCINSTIQLSVDPEVRKDINNWYRREVVPSEIDQSVDSSKLLRRLFRPGIIYNQLIDYYGESGYSGIEIPEVVPRPVELHQYVWRGNMALSRGGSSRGSSDSEWAKREYETLMERIEMCQDLPEPVQHDLESIALTNTAQIKKNQAKIEEAITDLREALELEPVDGSSPGKSTIFASLAELYIFTGDTTKAESCFRQACAIDRELGDRHSWAKHIGGLAVLYFERGESDIAQACNNTAKRVFQEIGDLQALTHVYGRTSDYLFDKGDYEAARSLTEQSLKINRQLDRNVEAAEDLMTLGSQEIRRHNPVPARKYTEQARSLFAAAGNHRSVAMCDGNLANVESLEGNWTMAKRQHQEVIDKLEDLGDETALARAHADLANTYLQCGDFTDALPQMEKAADMLFEVGEYRKGARLMINAGQIIYQLDAELEAGTLFGTAMMQLLAGESYDDALLALEYMVEIHLSRSNPKQSKAFALQGWLISCREDYPYWQNCFLTRYHMALSIFCPSLYELVHANLSESMSTDISNDDMEVYIERTAAGKNDD
ncbi:restriction endonuclease [Natranaeroarchaeum aerophilus]|uniref:Tetratricopeptide repeat protein n=1 Tax=Natranaeroarchaeum aerophilus TaxID=2917711 RepID=A0AAE3FTY0_9EURY|nr:restriction endonuclease [Natranaeroarchaeum aerophilus]MCL9815288.1 tetratricopeptide repeat protein [Natranaeroarchaeum aerophilus]